MDVARTFKVLEAAALLLVAQIGAAAPCGFDAPLGNTFTPMHPKSIGVAFAVHDAVASGVIEVAADPAVAGRSGYWHAVGHLTALQRALSAAQPQGGVPVSVLFIDSALWARLTPKADGFAMDVHTGGVQPGDVAVVTSEPVLAAILDLRLPVSNALERGLIAVDGEGAGAVRLLIAKALTAPEVAGAPQPVRLFGPVRQ